ncbi:hypothetical protein AgCh_021650 [Apium graveolens]
MNGDYVTSLEEFDTTGMDSVWLAIKIPRKTNDYRSVEMSPYEALYRKRCQSPLYQNEVGERKMLRKCNPDARQIGAYEHTDMQPDVTYMEQPGRVIDRKGTSA